jgi:hypothetical protein
VENVTMKFRLLALLPLLAACGDAEGAGRSLDGRSPSETAVALFVSLDYVEFDTTDSDHEGSNLYFSLRARGFAVDTFSTTDSAAVAPILAGADVLVLPEPENGSYDGFPVGTQRAIEQWVQAGGTLAWFAYPEEMNTIFDWELDHGDDDSFDSVILRDGFAGPFVGPFSLPYNDATDLIAASTLPPGSLKAYSASGDAALAVIPVGLGEAVFFGFDWFDAAPFGSQDGGWIRLLDGLAKF